MIFFYAMELAEIRHAEFLEEAAQHRQERRAARLHRGRRRWGPVVRDAVVALRVAGSSMRRPGLTQPVDLAPVVETA